MLFQKPKNIIIAGSGRLGSSLAGSLSEKGYHVIIIDKDEDAFRKLPESFSGYEVAGDAASTDLLERLDIKNAFMVIAVTDNDNTNSLIAQIASRIYGVNQVFARLNDIEKESLIKGFNIEVIYPFLLAVHEFERLTSISIREVFRA